MILAEGNTSQRLDEDRVVVKASGRSMQSATADDFVVISLARLRPLLTDPSATQQQLTELLDAGTVTGSDGSTVPRRGSIEALVHVAVHAVTPDPAQARFVGHTHPTDVVGLLASSKAEEAYQHLAYSDEAVVVGRPLFVPYAAPGIELGRLTYRLLAERVEQTGELPSLVLLGNHGIVAIAPTPQAVDGISAMAVKGARVRVAAYSVGGVAPLSDAAVEKFFARNDIADRRSWLSSGNL